MYISSSSSSSSSKWLNECCIIMAVLLWLVHSEDVVDWLRGVMFVGCRLIINDDLEKGSQMPYIERAAKEGYEVLVLNANLNRWPDGSQHRAAARPIPVCTGPINPGICCLRFSGCFGGEHVQLVHCRFLPKRR